MHNAIVCMLLALVTAAVFWPVVGCDFVNYDDPTYFVANPRVQAGLTPGNVIWAFSTLDAHNWHPLTWLSLMVDADMFGEKAAGLHFTNLFFHAANAVLLYLLLQRLTAAKWRSAFVAALFALHPLHVESVAWVSERKDVLSAFFGLLALICYARFGQEQLKIGAQNPALNLSPSSARGSRLNYSLALIFFVCALLSKPMMVTLPFVLLLLDWWPMQRLASLTPRAVVPLLLEKAPFFLFSAISCVITFWVQKKSGAMDALANVPLEGRLDNALVSYARYLGKTFLPVNLANPYPYPNHWKFPFVFASAVLLIGLSMFAVWLGKRFRFICVGWFWFVGMLIPVIGLVQVGAQSMADRYTYLPLTGVFIIFSWGTCAILKSGKCAAPLIATMAFMILFACALQSRNQIKFWKNSGTLFRHALAVTKNNDVAYSNLGAYLSTHGQMPEAALCFEEALKINPGDPALLFNYATAYYDIGLSLLQNGQVDESIVQFRKALEIYPGFKEAHNNLGNALSEVSQTDEAMVHFQKALEIDPNYLDAQNNFGITLLQIGRLDEAASHFEKVLQIKPDNVDALNDLGVVLMQKGRLDEAVSNFRKAVAIQPNYANAYVNLGDALARNNKPEAIKNYQTALNLQPGDESTRKKLQALDAEQ
jgi:tetratricopeptide (TPR) repeat protein